MEVKYVAVYKLRGANGLSSDASSVLFERESPKMIATLSADPEPYFAHIDRSLALGLQLLRGRFGEMKEGTPEERIAAEIQRIQTVVVNKFRTVV